MRKRVTQLRGQLAAIRRVRNDAVHGRPATPPPPDDLDHATAIVARLVVEHLIRRPSITRRGRET